MINSPYKCAWCGRKFSVTNKRLAQIKYHKKKGIVGPFCSKKCQGSNARARQLNWS